MKQPKVPKYTKRKAAEQLGVSLYKLNQMISAGVLPDKPTQDQVEKVIQKYAAALKKYSAKVVEAFEAGKSIKYCAGLVENAIAEYKLIIPRPDRPEQFVWGVVYRHQMKEKRRTANE